jgi:hypothetical protein
MQLSTWHDLRAHEARENRAQADRHRREREALRAAQSEARAALRERQAREAETLRDAHAAAIVAYRQGRTGRTPRPEPGPLASPGVAPPTPLSDDTLAVWRADAVSRGDAAFVALIDAEIASRTHHPVDPA